MNCRTLSSAECVSAQGRVLSIAAASGRVHGAAEVMG